ncbi:ABC-2 family transporter protein [Pendulispora brunnea]|uniref:ABC-2 family transporter protein n=1 Tax=Pendulispora brunnea TaxID=2905690 RepID=A0ABZ2KCN1_9BACT
MSLRNNVHALPTLLRIGFADAVAYRAEMLVWTLSATMPLIMLALWLAVASDAPMGRLGQPELIAYFLATFVVRQLTASWVCWKINSEVRDGTLAMRLLRPVHPLVAYAAENLAAIPLRGLLSLPVAIVALALLGTTPLPRDPVLWVLWAFSMAGAWLITLLANFAIGCLSLFMESSIRLMDVWFMLFLVFSGYLIPVELFPPAVRAIGDWMPFRYQLGLPVEIMTSAHDRATALTLVGQQWGIVALHLVFTALVWRRGLGRFAAFGG